MEPHKTVFLEVAYLAQPIEIKLNLEEYTARIGAPFFQIVQVSPLMFQPESFSVLSIYGQELFQLHYHGGGNPKVKAHHAHGHKMEVEFSESFANRLWVHDRFSKHASDIPFTISEGLPLQRAERILVAAALMECQLQQLLHSPAEMALAV